MKLCPYCAEEIQEAAIKCKHCGEFLDGHKPSQAKQDEKWYLKAGFVFPLFLFVGPLALPLIWINPAYSRNKKIVITVVVLVISYILGELVKSAVSSIGSYYEMLM